MKKNKGFTLIELLVVIAIIGILASVVLASLNSARNKGADAAIKSNLANMRAQAEILYDSNGAYDVDSNHSTSRVIGGCSNSSGTMWSSSVIWGQVSAAKNASSQGYASCGIGANANSWAVIIPLKNNPLTAWCVDSSGASKQMTITAISGQSVLDDYITPTSSTTDVACD